MSIIRVGATKKYSDGWDAAFAKGQKKSTKKAAAKKAAPKTSAKKKPTKKKK